MAIPTSYLTSVKNLPAILKAIQGARAPEKFTIAFLEGLGFKSNSDRLIVGVLKSLGFLDDQGKPLDPYFQYLDEAESKHVLAARIQDAYSDLFQVKRDAYKLSKGDVENKFKTLSQGSYSESVIDKMAMTFTNLVKQADFSIREEDEGQDIEDPTLESADQALIPPPKAGLQLTGGLHYNIQLILPADRDPKVYDALFKSLKEHLG